DRILRRPDCREPTSAGRHLLVAGRAAGPRRVGDDRLPRRRRPGAPRGAAAARGRASLRFRRSIRLSLAALLAHKVRTGLAVGSVGAGVAAVALTGALGAGAEQALRLRIQGMGANLLVVRPAQVNKLVARKEVKGLVTTLRLEDAADVEGLAVVAQAAPGVEAPVRVKGGGAAMKTKVVGTTPAFQTVRRFRLRSGRFLTDEDDRLSARVVVLGARVADALFPDEDPVGQPLRIRDVPFDIVGVLEAKGVQADGDA